MSGRRKSKADSSALKRAQNDKAEAAYFLARAFSFLPLCAS